MYSIVLEQLFGSPTSRQLLRFYLKFPKKGQLQEVQMYTLSPQKFPFHFVRNSLGLQLILRILVTQQHMGFLELFLEKCCSIKSCHQNFQKFG